MKNRIIIIFVMLFTVTACTIQKRQHLKGWNIEWNKQYKNTVENNQEHNANKANETALIDDKHSEKSVDEYVNVEEVEMLPIQNEITEIVEIESIPVVNDVQQENHIENLVTETAAEQATQSVLKKKTQQNESGNGQLLLITAFMALSILAGLRLGKNKLKLFTRWAKANPKKTQVLIASIQLPIMAMSIYGGYNLHKLGYSISEAPMYAAAGLMAIGMATVPFVMKREKFILPARLKRRKMAFLGVSLASMMLMVGFGNNVEKNLPDSFVSQSFQKIDQSIFSQNIDNSNVIVSTDLGSPHVDTAVDNNIRNNRKAVGAGMIILCVLGFILLTVTLCAGICMIGFALSGASSAILLGIGGLVVTILSIMAMVGISNAFRAEKEKGATA